MSAHGNALVTGLEQGVLALLGSKSTRALLRHVPTPSDLVLTCCALVALLRAVPPGAAVAGRVSLLVAQVLSTIALNTVLQWVSAGTDPPLACLGLVAVFFCGQALDPYGQMSTAAQYLLVANLSTALQGFRNGEGLATAWVLAFTPGREGLPADAAELARLVTVESLSVWLRGWFPPSLLLPSTAVLLYLCAPFTDEFPALQRSYRFAVFAFSADTQFALTPAWLLATALWALWQAEPDPVSRRLASIAGGNIGVLAILETLRFAMDADPAPTLLALLVGVQILEEVGSETQGLIDHKKIAAGRANQRGAPTLQVPAG